MNKIIQEIFRKKVIDFDKLLKYGFVFDKEKYAYSTDVVDGQMTLSIYIDIDGNINTEVMDLSTQEPYTLFLVEDAVGSFIGEVRGEYERVLEDIADKCCIERVFKSKYSQAVIEYVRNKYGDKLEFLWKKFDDNAIWRRKDNKKWYGALLTVAKNKLGLDGEEKIEILDLRMSQQEVEKVIDGKRYFSAYHMNKKSWITICLDGSLELQEIYRRIDESYVLALKK
ncbi:MAG: MmcQ/YjbR family DNA-binding protein [Clostridia bacterium]|nr:MmcQ/YjbR family DNA-binding protein [Clostridia bacterium]